MTTLPRLNPDELIFKLEQQSLENEGDCILAFDADHTLWDADVGVDVFEALLHSRKMRNAPAAALLAELTRFSIDIPRDSDVHELAQALHQSFLMGKYPDDLAYAMHAWAFAGFSEAEARQFADEVARAGGLDTKIRPVFRRILSWAKSKNITPYIVSASPLWMVQAGAALLGLDESNVLAMTPCVLNGQIQPSISGPVVYGEGKAQVLQGILHQENQKNAKNKSRVLLAAFGDSAWDASMLRLAKNPVAVTPKAGLLALAGSIEALIEMTIPDSPIP